MDCVNYSHYFVDLWSLIVSSHKEIKYSVLIKIEKRNTLDICYLLENIVENFFRVTQLVIDTHTVGMSPVTEWKVFFIIGNFFDLGKYFYFCSDLKLAPCINQNEREDPWLSSLIIAHNIRVPIRINIPWFVPVWKNFMIGFEIIEIRKRVCKDWSHWFRADARVNAW